MHLARTIANTWICGAACRDITAQPQPIILGLNPQVSTRKLLRMSRLAKGRRLSGLSTLS